MAFTGVRLKNRLQVHGTFAPSPAEALEGHQIINEQENIGLRIDEGQSESRVRLDTSVEPPVLHLDGALARCALSVLGIDESGNLLPTPADYPKGSPQQLYGEYTGPGCEIAISPARR